MGPMNWLKPRLDWLIVFLPVALVLKYMAPGQPVAIFVCSCLGLLPLAAWMGHATEHLATRAGEGIGGLLNASFGNAAELIIALLALYKGQTEMVKASLTGAIIGNILLVMGGSFLVGGLKHRDQKFNGEGARTYGSLLLLSAIALVVPATFHHLAPKGFPASGLSLEIAVVLLLAYGGCLLFSLHTHQHLFAGDGKHKGKGWSVKKALAVLALSSVGVGIAAEILVGSVEGAAHSMGMSPLFVGVIVVAIVGNAAEHSTALVSAYKNRMDLALGVALGSSIQIALFVAPVLVIAGQWLGPTPMDLVFTPAEVLGVVVTVWLGAHLTADGQSNWLEGVLLLALYLILGAMFYFLPVGPMHGVH